MYIVTLRTDCNELWEQMQFSIQNRSNVRYVDIHQGMSNHCQQLRVPAITLLFCNQKANSTITPVSQQNHGQGYSFPNHPARVPQVRLGQQRAPQPETEAKGEMTKAFC